LADRPCVKEFHLTRFLPARDVGPVDFIEFARLAMIFRADAGRGFAEKFSEDAAELSVELFPDDEVSEEFSEDSGFCSGKSPADACCIHDLMNFKLPVQGI
jgi:hypothetical protein